MIYDVSEAITRETLEARYVGFWTPESMQTAHPINRYEAGLHSKDLPHHNSERNNPFVQTIESFKPQLN